MTATHLRETLARLDAEWHHLLDTHPHVPLSWRRDCAAFAAASGLGEVLIVVRADPDAALGHLVRARAGGDDLSGRVVLQAILGKLVRMALVDPAASLDDYLAAAWERIVTYPVDARPTRIAANLVLDTLKAVKREYRRPVATPLVAPPQPDAATVLRWATEAGWLDADAVATLGAVYLEGRPGADVARSLGTSPGALRVRCHRAVQVLREHAVELADWAA